MDGDENKAPDQGAQAPKPGPSKPDEGSAFDPITSQDALDKIIEGRIARERKRYADYDDLKAAASTATEKAQAAEAAQTRIAELEAEIATSQAAALLATISSETGIPADLLTGETEEELRASAEKLSEFASTRKPASGAVVPTVGSTDTDSPDRDAAARAFLTSI